MSFVKTRYKTEKDLKENSTRNRNHRRKHCGTCESITQAHYYLNQEPYDPLEKIEKLKSMNVLHEEINGILLFIFSDETLLGYTKERGLYKIDSFLRKSNRRFA